MGAGLRNAARAAKRTNYPGTPAPAVGQRWLDLTIDAARVKPTDGGRETWINLDRFFPTSNGYRYLGMEESPS